MRFPLSASVLPRNKASRRGVLQVGEDSTPERKEGRLPTAVLLNQIPGDWPSQLSHNHATQLSPPSSPVPILQPWLVLQSQVAMPFGHTALEMSRDQTVGSNSLEVQQEPQKSWEGLC